jgi:hypothetical protein
MPAELCRIMPARSISWCDTICASAGVSLSNGRKYRDSRIGVSLGMAWIKAAPL